MAKGGHARIDESWVRARKVAIAKSKAIHHATRKILNQHIGDIDQPSRDVPTVLGLEIEIDRPAIAVDMSKMRRAAARRPPPRRTAARPGATLAGRCLNLHH